VIATKLIFLHLNKGIPFIKDVVYIHLAEHRRALVIANNDSKKCLNHAYG